MAGVVEAEAAAGAGVEAGTVLVVIMAGVEVGEEAVGAEVGADAATAAVEATAGVDGVEDVEASGAAAGVAAGGVAFFLLTMRTSESLALTEAARSVWSFLRILPRCISFISSGSPS